jgi:hypothetical protein
LVITTKGRKVTVYFSGDGVEFAAFLPGSDSKNVGDVRPIDVKLGARPGAGPISCSQASESFP